ncbi:ABC transporter ATP-binding protein [Micromonospora sp. RL09-050-HVF-A]|uniref:ABC transporter ATP-binding protein n=1 Tax=Micromonospora sp. RL09-050-HVF-A TaxID=1703433 RepID=UPI001C5E3016|nr:ABC transporter ATP-binding protein [Micromonospora sp. RL09-050-HVF-A]MBW4701244.1 ABC transporter ATP-binding protein [Micromonospora sp. RL09-050-HVF-A]
MTPDDRLLLRAVRAAGWWTPTLAVVTVAGTAAELALPAVLGRAVDAAVGAAPQSSPGRWLAAVTALVALLVVVGVIRDYGTGAATARSVAHLRHTLVGHLFALDPRTAARRPVGDLAGRVVGQVADAGQAAPTVVTAATVALPPLGSLVALTLIDPWLGVTFVLGLLLLALLLRGFVADASAAVAGYQQAQGDLAGRLVETLAGARTIAAAGTGEREVDRVLTPLAALHRHGARTWTVLAGAATRGAVLNPLLQVAIVAVGGLSLTAGRLTPGELLAAIQYAALGAGLGTVVAALNTAVRVRAGCRRAAEVLAEPARPYGTRALPPGPGTLELRGVTVRDAEGRALLDRVDLRVPGGTLLAVVGASGAGKSLLAAVAGRLRDPDDGVVLLDGVPLPELAPAALHAAVGYGFERPVLVGETVGAAVGVGVDPVPLARAAAIHDFVERLPDRYGTPLAEVAMSGGERQRLGLARALRAERLLILDDATSSLDTATEYQVTRALTGPGDRRTRVVVSHRLGMAARADLVAWVAGGRVRAVGPHPTLWADPDYREVFRS